MIKIIFALLFAFLSADLAQATTYYVRPGGTNFGDCTATGAQINDDAHAKQTITAAIACAGAPGTEQGAGDIVAVAGGTYNESLFDTMPSGSSAAAPFILRCTVPRTCTIRSSANNVTGFGSTAHYIEINGFIIDGLNSALAGVRVTTSSSSTVHHIKIVNNEITNSSHGVLVSGGSFLEITGNTIHHGGSGTPHLDHGIYLSNLTIDSVIDGNEVYDWGGYGIQLYTDDNTLSSITVKNNYIHNEGTNGDNGGILFGASSSVAYNNIIANNAGEAGITFYANCSSSSAYNNTIYNNEARVTGIDGCGSGGTIKNNLIISSGTITNCSAPACANNITSGSAATIFTNASGAFSQATDFQLKPKTTPIDAGANLSTVFTTDYANRSRGLPFDIGAYEYNAGVSINIVINQPTGCSGNSSACTINNIPNPVTLTGSTNQAGGSVAAVNNRDPATTITATGSWTASVNLKSGVNRITVTGLDSSGNAGSAIITITYVPTFPGNARVAAYSFDEASGDALDLTGAGRTGQLVNGATRSSSARFGSKALSLNAASQQYVLVTDANPLDFTQGFSITAWVQPTVARTDFAPIVFKDAGALNEPYSLYSSIVGSGGCTSGGIIGYSNANGLLGLYSSACDSTPLTVGNWTFIALTYDGTSLKLYKSTGAAITLLTTTTMSPAPAYLEPSTGNLLIGGSSYTEYFTGLIDELRLYNFPLPLTGGNNSVFGAACNQTDADAIITMSLTGDANCPVTPLAGPVSFKVGSASVFKLGSGAILRVGGVPQ